MTEYQDNFKENLGDNQEELNSIYDSFNLKLANFREVAILPLSNLIFRVENPTHEQLTEVINGAVSVVEELLQKWDKLENSDDSSSIKLESVKRSLTYAFTNLKNFLIHAIYKIENQGNVKFKQQPFEDYEMEGTDLSNDIISRKLRQVASERSIVIGDEDLSRLVSFLDHPSYIFPNGEKIYLPQIAYSESRFADLRNEIESSSKISSRLAAAEACMWSSVIREPYLKTFDPNSVGLVRESMEKWFDLCDGQMKGLGSCLRKIYGKIIPQFSELNESEERGIIKESPREDLKVAVLVPVFNEYRNGHLFRLIHAFSRQQGVSVDEFELIFLINRTTAVAEDSEASRDNNSALHLLKAIAEPKEELEVANDFRQMATELARRKGLVVHAIDLTSNPVRALSQDSKSNVPIGRIRQLGLREAIRRFAHTPQRELGIVANIDADTVPPANYIHKVISKFEEKPKDPNLVLLADLNLIAPHTREKSALTHFEYEFDLINRQFKPLVFGDNFTMVSSCRIIGRVGAYESVGGFNQYSSNEDFMLYRDFNDKKEVHLEYAPDIRVFTADRLPEMGSKGFDASALRDRVSTSYDSPRKEIVSAMIANIFKDGLETSNPEVYENQAEKICELLNLPYTKGAITTIIATVNKSWEEQIRASIIGDSYAGTFKLAKVSIAQVVNEWEVLLRVQLSPEEFEDLESSIRTAVKRASLQLSTQRIILNRILENFKDEDQTSSISSLEGIPKIKEWLEQNEWLITYIKSKRVEHKDYNIFKRELEKTFPEWFASTIQESGTRLACAKFKGLFHFFQRASVDPIKYPEASRFISQCHKS